MIPISSALVKSVISNYTIDINRHAKNMKNAFKRLKKVPLTKNQNDYVAKLEKIGGDLIVGDINKLEGYKTDLDLIYKFKTVFASEAEKEDQLKFKNKILDALAYETRRSDFYPQYFRKIGIKSCVYCNSQLCVTIDDEKGNQVAKFQVDHYIPKSEYPCFSVSLFNLYPVCASCNNKKGAKNINFALYVDVVSPESMFNFELIDKESTATDYLTNRNHEIISVKFNEPPSNPGESFNEVFAISGIYNTQVDIIEELILKSHIYSGVYKALIEDYMKEIYGSKDVLDRLIVGNYIEEADLHKRPLAKFTQDIARQLGLIS